MAPNQTSDNRRNNAPEDHPLGKESNDARQENELASKEKPRKNWFLKAFKKTAFSIWVIVMAIGVTLAFIASLLLL